MPNVSNLVKTIQDIMPKDAGTYGDAQRLEQLGWMFFLKIFDDREKEMEVLRDNYKSPLPQHLRWSKWAADDEGDTGEKLLKDLQSAGNAGEFYTPSAVTQFIVEQVNPRLGETILDPACGTGGFLVCAIEHLRKQAKTEADERTIQDCFAGIEKKHLSHVRCMTNLLLHGIDVPSNVRHDNTLARPLRD
jgi:type I restriction-modification system DNA methylase subunit